MLLTCFQGNLQSVNSKLVLITYPWYHRQSSLSIPPFPTPLLNIFLNHAKKILLSVFSQDDWKIVMNDCLVSVLPSSSIKRALGRVHTYGMTLTRIVHIPNIVLCKMFSRWFFANKKLIITIRTSKFGDVTYNVMS